MRICHDVDKIQLSETDGKNGKNDKDNPRACRTIDVTNAQAVILNIMLGPNLVHICSTFLYASLSGIKYYVKFECEGHITTLAFLLQAIDGAFH